MLVKLYPGCWRERSTLSYAFGHIVRERSLWAATIRNTETGDLIRHAGRWRTLHEAHMECADLLFRDYRAEG